MERFVEVDRDYSSEEINNAKSQWVNFLVELKKAKVREHGNERELNELEKFIYIYEFVADRVYEDTKTSHDVVGVLNTNKGVCEGFIKLLKSLCDEVGIKFLYKHSVVNETLDSHGNAEIYIEDKNGKKHCLHCDPTIDCRKTDEDVLKYNGMLIADSDINRYYHTQIWDSRVGLYSNLFNGESDINIGISDMDKMMAEIRGEDISVLEKYEEDRIREELKKISSFFHMEISDKELETSDQMREVYRKLYQCYKEAQVPIDNNEFMEALINVQISKFINRGVSFYEAQRKAKEIIRERVEASIKCQKEFWNNVGGNSFMFDIVSGNFDFENMLVNRENAIGINH